jgi:hypothetical protein
MQVDRILAATEVEEFVITSSESIEPHLLIPINISNELIRRSAPSRQFAQTSNDFSSLNAEMIPILAQAALEKNRSNGCSRGMAGLISLNKVCEITEDTFRPSPTLAACSDSPAAIHVTTVT